MDEKEVFKGVNFDSFCCSKTQNFLRRPTRVADNFNNLILPFKKILVIPLQVNKMMMMMVMMMMMMNDFYGMVD